MTAIPPEGRIARALRHAVLGLFLALCLGFAGWLLANLPPGIRREDAGVIGILLVYLLFGARVAWEAFHQCRPQGLWTGAVLLLLASLALPGLAMLQDAFQEPEERGATTLVPLALGVVGLLWAMAAIGAVPAAREARRRRGG